MNQTEIVALRKAIKNSELHRRECGINTEEERIIEQQGRLVQNTETSTLVLQQTMQPHQGGQVIASKSHHSLVSEQSLELRPMT